MRFLLIPTLRARYDEVTLRAIHIVHTRGRRNGEGGSGPMRTLCVHGGGDQDKKLTKNPKHLILLIWVEMHGSVIASGIWLRTIQIAREETHCRHMSYFFRLAARVLLYALSHRQDSDYHGLCYTSRGSLTRTRNSSMGPPWKIDPTILHLHLAPSRNACPFRKCMHV